MSLPHHHASLVKASLHDRAQRKGYQHRRLRLTAPPQEPPAVDISALTDDTVLCHCHQVTVSQVKEAIKSGAATVEQVMTLTDLGQSCGCCVGDAWPLVQELLAAK